MRCIKISFSSLGSKLLCIILTVALFILNIVLLFYREQIPWYAICYAVFALLFCLFGSYLCFNHRLVFDKKRNILKICNLTNKKLEVNQIVSIEISTKNSIDTNKYCFVIFKLKNGTQIKYSEYFTLNKNKAVTITKKKIKLLSQYIPIVRVEI